MNRPRVLDSKEIPMDKLKHIKTEQQAWGDLSTYTIDASDMPSAGDAHVMQQKNYSQQPEFVTRNEDGSGSINLFWSIGD